MFRNATALFKNLSTINKNDVWKSEINNHSANGILNKFQANLKNLKNTRNFKKCIFFDDITLLK